MSEALEGIYNLFRNLGSILEFIFDFLKSGITFIGNGFSWFFSFGGILPGSVSAVVIAVLCVAIILLILGR